MGCSNKDDEMDRILTLRKQLEEAQACEFDAVITADYTDRIYTFSMKCRVDKSGKMDFSVTSPETIADISGSASGDGGTLTFDDRVLGFELLADGMISPVSAPWLIIRSLRSGYVEGCSASGGGMYAEIADSYMGENLLANLWFDEKGLPQSAELIYIGKRFLSVSITNFVIV